MKQVTLMHSDYRKREKLQNVKRVRRKNDMIIIDFGKGQKVLFPAEKVMAISVLPSKFIKPLKPEDFKAAIIKVLEDNK